MQELRSTDILDKEIQADARKKAERMLEKADRDCQQLLASFHLVLGCLVDVKDLSFIGLDGLYGIVQDRLQGICAQIPRLVQEFLAASHHRLLTFPRRCSGCAS